MSWTQGVWVREDMDARHLEALERNYRKATGESSRVEYVTWFKHDGSDAIAHFESGRGFELTGRKT